MLLPSLRIDAANPCLGLILCPEREPDMSHGLFGDRDAGSPAPPRRLPRACGLFGRSSDDPPIAPANPFPGKRTDRPRPTTRHA
ncbi:hypothetical protein [Sphingomonas profundi]|uniref:hypothetical protein n=1 Tax=Alterirhizorhabdus profundi TaxID=2681549 RepID=UPI0012E749E9|nr:hypothetical protein [Sphingomonas profundi]